MKVWGRVPAGAKALQQAECSRTRRKEPECRRHRGSLRLPATHWGLEQEGDSRAPSSQVLVSPGSSVACK